MENFKCMCENLKLSKENLQGLKLLFAVDLPVPVWPVDFLCVIVNSEFLTGYCLPPSFQMSASSHCLYFRDLLLYLGSDLATKTSQGNRILETFENSTAGFHWQKQLLTDLHIC